MSQKTLFKQTALAVAVAIVSTSAWSAGFQLNEFSSSGLGRAYSGEGAIADDAGNASRNPALIMMFDRPTFSAGAVYIDPDVNISGKSQFTGADPIQQQTGVSSALHLLIAQFPLYSRRARDKHDASILRPRTSPLQPLMAQNRISEQYHTKK